MNFKHQDIIDEFWWKTASLMTQVDAWNGDIVLPYTPVKTIDFESWNSKELDLQWSQIVRWSASWDERWLVDLIKTKLNVSPDVLNAWTIKRIDISKLPERQNYLELLMHHHNIGLERIAKALEIDTQDLDSKYSYQEALREYFRNSEFGYAQPFFICRTEGNLNIEFSEEEIRELEYGDVESNPIQEIIASSKGEGIKKFVKRWDGIQSYDWVQSTLIQPMNYNEVRWSIVEHPHIEWHYLLNLVEKSDSSTYEYIFQFLLNHKWEVIAKDFSDGLEPPSLRASFEDIVKMKQRSRKVWFIPEQYSSQVELLFLNDNSISWEGHDFSQIPTSPVIQAQERAFIPFDFENGVTPENYHFNNFWIPKEGLNLRVINLNDGYDKIDQSLFNDGLDSVYVLSEGNVNRKYGSLGFIPNNMKAVIIPDGASVHGNSLEHKTYQYIVKAWVAIMLDSRYHSHLPERDITNWNLHTWENIRLTNR